MSTSYQSPDLNARNPKLRKMLDQLADILRAKHYSYRTEQAYVYWVRRKELRDRDIAREQGRVELSPML